MDEWRGRMNQPLDPAWQCKVCGGKALTWGIVNGVCRCDICHTEYTVRDRGVYVTVPIWLIFPAWASAAIAGWKLYQKPLDKWSDAEWEAAKALPAVGA